MLDLRTSIEARVETSGVMAWQRGTLIGRTLEANPRYDVALDDGRMIGNLPADHVRVNKSIDMEPVKIPFGGKIS